MLASTLGTLVFALLLQFWSGKRGEVAAPWILLAAAVPVAIVCLNLWDAQANARFGDLRLSMTAIHIDSTILGDDVTIGGDPRKDILYVPQVNPGLVSFKRNGAKIEIRIARPTAAPMVGVVSIEDGKKSSFDFGSGKDELIGERSVTPGEPFCIAHCRGTDPCNVLLTWPQNRLTLASDPTLATPQMVKRPMSFISWGAQQRIYSIRTYAVAQEGQEPDSCADALSGTSDNAPTAFLFRKSKLTVPDRMYGMFLDQSTPSKPDAVLTPGGPALHLRIYRVSYAPSGVDQDSERTEHIAERRSLLASVDQDGILTLQLDTPEFHRPLRASNIAALVATKREGEHIVLFVDCDRSSGRTPIGDATLQFDSLGGPLAESALGRVVLTPDHSTNNLASVFTSIGGGETQNHPFGSTFSLGHEYRADFRLDRLGRDDGVLQLIGWPLMLLIATALLMSSWSLRRENSMAWRILVLTEAMLALRLLIAISGAFLAPDADRAHVVASGLIAYASVPFIVAQFGSPRPKLWPSAIYSIFVLLLATLLWFRYGISPISGFVAIAAPIVALSGVIATTLAKLLVRMESAYPRTRQILELRRRRFDPHGWAESRIAPAARGYPVSSRAIVAALALVALLLARGILLLLGAKEAFPFFGQRVALSTVYLPLALYLLVTLLNEFVVSARSASTSRTGVAFAIAWSGAFAVTFALPGLIANDKGFVIFGLGLALMPTLVFAEMNRNGSVVRSWFGWWILAGGALLTSLSLIHNVVFDEGPLFKAALAIVAAPALLLFVKPIESVAWMFSTLGLALVASLLLFNSGYPGITLWLGATLVYVGLRIRPTLAWVLVTTFTIALAFSFRASPLLESAMPSQIGTASPEEVSLANLHDQNLKTANDLRIWYNMQPSEVGDVGTTEGQNLGAAIAHLGNYTSCKPKAWPRCLLGAGFLAVPPPTVLAAYHLNDNVTAIHLVAPFGRAGAAAFLALLFTVLLLSVVQLVGANELALPSRNAALGVAVLATIAGTALYMIFANTLILPFTGKNVYFLAVQSGSDLLEGTLMLIIAMMCLGRRKDSECG